MTRKKNAGKRKLRRSIEEAEAFSTPSLLLLSPDLVCRVELGELLDVEALCADDHQPPT